MVTNALNALIIKYEVKSQKYKHRSLRLKTQPFHYENHQLTELNHGAIHVV